MIQANEANRRYIYGLDLIRTDRTQIVVSIDPVNPAYIYKVERIGGDWVALGDSHKPRSALGVPSCEPLEIQEPRDKL